MKFIRLTQTTFESENPLFINQDKIDFIRDIKSAGNFTLVKVNGSILYVTETVEEIMKILK